MISTEIVGRIVPDLPETGLEGKLERAKDGVLWDSCLQLETFEEAPWKEMLKEWLESELEN